MGVSIREVSFGVADTSFLPGCVFSVAPDVVLLFVDEAPTSCDLFAIFFVAGVAFGYLVTTGTEGLIGIVVDVAELFIDVTTGG